MRTDDDFLGFFIMNLIATLGLILVIVLAAISEGCYGGPAPEEEPCPPERMCLGTCCAEEDYRTATKLEADDGGGAYVAGDFAWCEPPDAPIVRCPLPVVLP